MQKDYESGKSYLVGGDTFNEIAAAVRWVNRRTGATAGDATATSTDGCDSGESWVRNSSGSDWGQFACVKITGLAATPDDWVYEAHILSAELAGAADSGANLAITTEPIADGAVGKILLLGVTPAQITLSGGTTATKATPAADGTLTGGDTGPLTVLSLAGGTGTTRWAVLQLGGAGGGSELAEVTLSGATVTISPVAPRTLYRCTNTVSQLTFSGGTTLDESFIRFTAGRNIAVDAGASKWAWGQGAFEGGHEYCLSVLGDMVNMAELT